MAAPAEQSQVGRGILIAKTSSLLRRIATALGQESAEPSFVPVTVNDKSLDDDDEFFAQECNTDFQNLCWQSSVH